MTRIVYQLPIASSKWTKMYLFSVHILATLAALVSDVPVHWQGAMILVFLLSFAYCYRKYMDKDSRHFVSRLERDERDMWSLVYGSRHRIEALKLKGAVVNTLGTILYFEPRYLFFVKSVLISADAVDSELYRQLRVYCRDPSVFQK